MNPKFWHCKRVLLTGHTGFKGSWLAFWLQRLGAEICGYSLPAPTEPAHWSLMKLYFRSEIADIRDSKTLEKVFREFRPEIVFHLAAQSLVRASYRDPAETYSTNVMGTLNVFEACRKTESVRAVINVTSDKCYENREWTKGYREEDAMGGYDPYSSSKGCSELLTASYRNSYFNNAEFDKKHRTLLASCRAGNVIGGGDWAEDRLVPDIMRAAAAGKPVDIRNPGATRPWQHVLEPLSGYLLVGRRLLEGKPEYATGWNFGPDMESVFTVKQLIESIQENWPAVEYRLAAGVEPHEANLLQLDISNAGNILGWKPVWNKASCLAHTVSWYRTFYESGGLQTPKDLDAYLSDAVGAKVMWVSE